MTPPPLKKQKLTGTTEVEEKSGRKPPVFDSNQPKDGNLQLMKAQLAALEAKRRSEEAFELQKPKKTRPYINQIRGWISVCDKLHQSVCVPDPISQQFPEDVPYWLVDTNRQCIIPGMTAHRYLALSYVWAETRDTAAPVPHAPESLLLTCDSLVSFQTPGYFSNDSVAQRIPPVIRHALALTAALGERYLWVDRLCIVQNDTGDGGTTRQIAKMDKIYSGAYLTILAAASYEIYDSVPSLEWPAFISLRDKESAEAYDLPSNPFALRHQKPGNVHLGQQVMTKQNIIEVMSTRYHTLSKSRWATRGWTYQEHILCRRAVILTDDGLFWDCQRCMWDGVDLFPGHDFDGIALRADTKERLLTTRWPDFSLYLDIICPYNGRQFSFPQDASRAISGPLNMLKAAFPDGFIHGMPRLFLDHALLWQPFGIAQRRIDRTEVEGSASSLPSWSWCGWQAYVDPWSLRSGLSTSFDKECLDRVVSWRTTNLVAWQLLIGDQTLDTIIEPRVPDELVNTGTHVNIDLRAGWECSNTVDLAPNKLSAESAPTFTHSKDSSMPSMHPLPFKDNNNEHCRLDIPAYLACTTKIAVFSAATVLVELFRQCGVSQGMPKISVFDNKIFKLGPSKAKSCPVLVLQQSNGMFAGLLRLMQNTSEINEADPIELIAISTGRANSNDFCKSFEWRVFETTFDNYSDGRDNTSIVYHPKWTSADGKKAFVCDIATAFSKNLGSSSTLEEKFSKIFEELESRVDKMELEDEILRSDLSKRFPELANRKFRRKDAWFHARREFHQVQRDANHMYNMKVKASSASELQQSQNLEDGGCEFYNVLWIMRRDGVAYRKACGWVPKHVWEAYATGPVEIKLG